MVETGERVTDYAGSTFYCGEGIPQSSISMRNN